MATITNREIIVEMLDNDGRYPGDPQMHSIWKYNGGCSKTDLYAIFATAEHDMFYSPYVRDPILLWDRLGLTPAGKAMVGESK